MNLRVTTLSAKAILPTLLLLLSASLTRECFAFGDSTPKQTWTLDLEQYGFQFLSTSGAGSPVWSQQRGIFIDESGSVVAYFTIRQKPTLSLRNILQETDSTQLRAVFVDKDSGRMLQSMSWPSRAGVPVKLLPAANGNLAIHTDNLLRLYAGRRMLASVQIGKIDSSKDSDWHVYTEGSDFSIVEHQGSETTLQILDGQNLEVKRKLSASDKPFSVLSGAGVFTVDKAANRIAISPDGQSWKTLLVSNGLLCSGGPILLPGNRVASALCGGFVVMAASGKREVEAVFNSETMVKAVRASPDGRYIAVIVASQSPPLWHKSSPGKKKMRLLLYELGNNQPLHTIEIDPLPRMNADCAVSEGADWLILNIDGMVYGYKLENRGPVVGGNLH